MASKTHNENVKSIEETQNFTPRFDSNGLMPCITIDEKTHTVLMFAWMNKEALDKTLKTKEMHFWSRSRNELWHKGATSSNVLVLKSLRIDCDQDCLLAYVSHKDNTKNAACHTGRITCFYREIDLEKKSLKFADT